MLTKLKEDIFMDRDNKNLRCILLKSTGPVFSSGHDLKELLTSPPEIRASIFKICTELMIGMRVAPIPVIAQVQGLAAAAGCQLVASCDIVIGTMNAQFSTPGASVGLFCSTPGVAVSRAVSQKLASYMLLTGKAINAQEAYQCGLISKLVSEDDLECITNEIVQAILDKNRDVLASGKRFFYEQLEQDIETAYRNGCEMMVNDLSRDYAVEGINAFFAKSTVKSKS